MARALTLFQQIDRYSAPYVPYCQGQALFLAGGCGVTMKSAYVFKVGRGVTVKSLDSL